MSKINEDMLWNYIDGSCSDEERQQIEQALAEDPELKQALAERLALHQALQKIEAEVPSMRFAANIMEKLPNIRFSLPQLISPKQKRRFLLGIGGISTLILALVFSLPEQSVQNENGLNTEYVNQWVEWTTTIINSPITMMGACIGISFILFSYLDKYLKKQFLIKKSVKR